MRDVSTSRQLARQMVEDDLEVAVYEKGQSSQHHRTFNAFYQRLNLMRESGENMNLDVLNIILNNLEFASVSPSNGPNDAHGRSPFRLIHPGCRAYLMQSDIKDAMRCSIETVRSGIKKLRRWEIIVNWGRGWIELDADFFWKGNDTVRNAYTMVQRRRDEKPIVTP